MVYLKKFVCCKHSHSKSIQRHEGECQLSTISSCSLAFYLFFHCISHLLNTLVSITVRISWITVNLINCLRSTLKMKLRERQQSKK